MKIKTTLLQTPETLKQLVGDFLRAIRKLAKVERNYIRKPNVEKVEPQAELLELYYHDIVLTKQKTLKIINQSPTVANAIANEVLSTKDPKKRQQGVLRLRRLVQILISLKEDTGRGIVMSKGIGNKAEGVSYQIDTIRKQTEAKLAAIANTEQQARQQTNSQQRKAA
mgnify:CR=1 FL=1